MVGLGIGEEAMGSRQHESIINKSPPTFEAGALPIVETIMDEGHPREFVNVRHLSSYQAKRFSF